MTLPPESTVQTTADKDKDNNDGAENVSAISEKSNCDQHLTSPDTDNAISEAANVHTEENTDLSKEETTEVAGSSEQHVCMSAGDEPGTSEMISENVSLSEQTTVKVLKDSEGIPSSSEEDKLVAQVSLVQDTQLPAEPKIPTPPEPSLHHIKQIQFRDKKTAIVTQNENGPCPLIAIINVLLLQHQVELPSGIEIISAAKLIEFIGNTILEYTPKNLNDERQLNYEQNMNDAMMVLPKLQTGLDVNVKFTGVQDFEYTPECIIFDLMRIPLYHGWLVDPQAHEIAKAIGNSGYNQVVEKVITNKSSTDPNLVTEALIMESFLERTASQLTYHGLSELNQAMKEGELAVLFRNNHFSTLYKRKSELFQLVTDQGFLSEPSVVWETLANIEGDGEFVDSSFHTVPPKTNLQAQAVGNVSVEQQIDQDFLVALSLQEGNETLLSEDSFHEAVLDEDKTAQEIMDRKLAQKLQEEERRQSEAEQSPPSDRRDSRQTRDQREAKSKKQCKVM